MQRLLRSLESVKKTARSDLNGFEKRFGMLKKKKIKSFKNRCPLRTLLLTYSNEGGQIMSNPKLPSSRDFSIFNQLSTEELKRLVRQYSLAEYEETDDEAILYILEVIAQRNELNTDESPSATSI